MGSPNLPTEILLQIFSNLPRTRKSQPTLHSSTLVSRSWYPAAVQVLYRSPYITGKNFKLFVSAICPSINAHVRKHGLSEMVRRLDMSRLIHHGSKSLTARILGRCKGQLEEFVAPQVSFAVNCLAALSKCTNLRCLDLSYMSESLDLVPFSTAISKLDKLQTLHFPRSLGAINWKTESLSSWPMNLCELHLSGNLTDNLGPYLADCPPALTNLSLHDCPCVDQLFLDYLFHTLGSQLLTLEITHHLKQVKASDFAIFLSNLPLLRRLSLPAENLTQHFFFFVVDPNFGDPLPLEELRIRHTDTRKSSTDFADLELCWSPIYDAVTKGRWKRLRKIELDASLGWLAEDMEDLDSLLYENGEEAGSDDKEMDAGIQIV